MALGRTSHCARCGTPTRPAPGRVKLIRELNPPQQQTIAYLCEDCGDILASGDILTFIEKPFHDARDVAYPQGGRLIERSNPR